MRLYIKNECIQNRPGFAVYDETEVKKYLVSVDHSVLGMKLDLFNYKSKRIAKIRQRGHSFNKSYRISAAEKNIKLILKINENNIDAFIKGVNWTIDGDLSSKDFCVLNENKFTIMVHKCNHVNNIEYHEVNINDCKHELLCLCISLCIDTILFFHEKVSESNVLLSVKSIFDEKKILRGLSETSLESKFYNRNFILECDINEDLNKR